MDIQVGQTVTRLLAGCIPMELIVTEVGEKLIKCGSWEFDRESGLEVDPLLGAPPQYISHIVIQKEQV